MIKIDFTNIYKYSAIVFAFILPLSRAGISFFVGLFILLWIVEGDLKNKLKNIYQNNVLRAVLLFLFFVFLSYFWSDNQQDALKFIRLYSYWFVIFVLATSIKKDYIQPIITSFLYGMLGSEIIAYGVFFELWTFKDATVSNPSPFMFWIDYSVFLALTAILLLNRLFSSNYTNKEKIFIFLFFITVTGNLFLTIGRTGQVAFFFSIFIMFFLYYKINIKSIIYGIVTIAIIFTLAINISSSFSNRVQAAQNDFTLMMGGKYDSSWGIRVAYIVLGKDIIKENSLFGIGVGDLENEINHKLDTIDYGLSAKSIDFMKDMHPHNQYLMVMLQLGLIGLVLMLNIFYQFIKVNLQRKDIELRNLSILFVSVYMVSFLAEPLWTKQFTIVLFILFISLFSINDNETRITS